MCSVSLSKEGELLNVIEESAQKYIHSEKLTLLITALLKEAGVAYEDSDTVSLELDNTTVNGSYDLVVDGALVYV